MEDRTSAPARRPSRPPIEVIELIDSWRREKKWSARRIALELAGRGHHYCVRTIGRWLQRLGVSRRRDLDPTGENNRETGKIIARFPGHMLHLDVKKVGQIPAGGGWRLHGRGNAKKGKQRVGYTYLHSAIDGYSRLAYTEALENETAATTIGFFSRARAFFAAHGINRLVRMVTDNGTNYRAKTFMRAVNAHASRHQRTRPYTPRHNGKVERYQRIFAEECLYAHAFFSEGERREAIGVWVHHYNYCESLSGWSGTGWQGERRAAPAPRPWLLQLFAPKGAFRWTCPTPVRDGRRSPGPLRWLDQKTVRSPSLRRGRDSSQYCPEVTSIQARAGA